jgi:hypothetical protein
MHQLFCRFAGHRRSSERARRTADGWQSQCTRCNGPLVRRASGKWVERGQDVAPTRADFQQAVMFAPTGAVIRVKAPAA